MKKFILLVLLVVSLVARGQTTEGDSQANIGGLLIASNFAQWTVPQGNQGGYSWSSPDFCKSNYAGATFNAFSNGTPVAIVDTGNPNNSEVVTVLQFNSTAGGCSIQVNPTHVHNTFFFRSATAGLGEALAFAGQQLYQVILTPNFTKLGGLTSTVTSAHGNSNVTILDQRSSVIVPYLWNGTAYVANPFAGGVSPGGTTGAVQYNSAGAFGGLNGTGLLKLNGAGAPTIATSGTDYALPNANTTGSAGSLSAASALPNGTTATTQTTGDSTTKVATDAFVIANQSTATIPATSNVLKGSGSAGAAAIATPGTDYVAPSTTVNGHALSANVVVSASDLTTGTLPHAQLPTLISGDIPNNAANTSGTAANLSGTPTLPNGTLGITQSPGDNTAKLATDAFVLANGGGATPGGSNTDVQVNSSGVFTGYAGFTYDNSTHALTVGPLGTANSGANFNSGTLQTCASYWTGSVAAPDCWEFQIQPDPGANPFSEFHLIHNGSSGGGQVVLPLTQFTAGIELNSLNDTGSANLQGPTNMPAGSYTAIMPGSAPAGSATLLSCPFLSGTDYQCLWTTGGGGGSAFVTPQQFGGFGDAYAQPDGCTTTASSTTINCRDATFVSTAVDGGKQIWVPGAGAAGVAYHGTIVSVTDASDVVVTPAPSISVGYNVLSAVYGHDDVTAVQECMQYSANHGVQCVLAPLAIPAGGNEGYAGYLIGSGGLTLPVNNLGASANVTGSSYTTNLFCEFNGDCISLAAGAVQSAIVSNLALIMDATQASSRAFHFNATAGPFGTGGLWNSTFTNIVVNNAPNECMWMDGGGGPGYTFLLPNQIDTFIQFQCNGANQMHTASLIKLTGQAAQILFENGQTNGASVANYPNYQIEIDQGQVGWDVAPVDVKFIGYTMEVGQKGLLATDASNNIHFDNGYLEDITLVGFTLTNSPGFTFNGNHIASTAYGGGAIGIGNLTGGSTASIRDNWVYGNTPASLAVCSGSNNSIDFAGDVVQAEPTNLLTTNCATATATSASGNLTIGQGAVTASITCVGGAVVNLNAPGVQPGKTLTLYAPASGCQLGSGGDIAMGNYTSPITLPAGGTATLTLLDNGVTFLVTDAPAPTSFSLLTAGANTDTGNFSTSGAWTFHNNVYIGSGSPSTFANNGAIAPSAYDQFTTNQIGGTCSMSAGTTCTITIGNNYAAPICMATDQTSAIAAGCSVSGTTVTITAASSNSDTWGAFVFGNSH